MQREGELSLRPAINQYIIVPAAQKAMGGVGAGEGEAFKEAEGEGEAKAEAEAD